PALYLLALLERQLNNSQKAADLLQRVAALEPRNAVAFHLLAQNLLQLGRIDDAVQAWKSALEADPEHAEALYNLARVLQKEDSSQARQYQQRFSALQQKRQMTDQADTLGNFGLASASARDWPQAVAHLKEALQVCGQCKSLRDIHKNLGLIYSRSGDLRKGEEQLRLALKIKPYDADVLKALQVIASLTQKGTATQ
ncbi:MAG: tetratricopeptide repeat protein, partial [Terriglobia bacterium]